MDESGQTRRSGRRRLVWAGGVVALVVVAVGLALTQPWKLFVDDVVDEALPGASAPSAAVSDPTSTTAPDPGAGAASAEAPTTTTTEPPGPVTLSRGDFSAHAHPTTGSALVVDVDGTGYVRFEDLRTDNGPDLVVVLSREPVDAQAVGDDFLELGALKGNVGNQNYELPAGVDLSEYASVVIWCRRFSVSFGAAPVAVG